MTDETALAAACMADPRDNTARLVYADWLDEHGGLAGAARAEWIRLTCHKPRKSVTVRQAGERDWMAANAHRIWPTLVSAVTGRTTNDAGWVRHADFKMSTGAVAFRTKTLIPTSRDATHLPGVSWVEVKCSRGVTHWTRVTFTRASGLARLVVADEPHAQLRLSTYAVSWNPNQSAAFVPQRPYDVFRLSGVWAGLAGGVEVADENGARFRRYESISAAGEACMTSLAAWARRPVGGTTSAV